MSKESGLGNLPFPSREINNTGNAFLRQGVNLNNLPSHASSVTTIPFSAILRQELADFLKGINPFSRSNLQHLPGVGAGAILAAVPTIVRAQEAPNPEEGVVGLQDETPVRIGDTEVLGEQIIDATNAVAEEIIAAVPAEEPLITELTSIDPNTQPQTETLDTQIELPKTPAQLFEERLEKERAWGYTQFLTSSPETGGILIKAPASVDPKALERAKSVLEKMTIRDTEIVTLLRSKNLEAIIIPKDKNLTQLPEYVGLAGVLANGRPYDKLRGYAGGGTAVGEEHLTRNDNNKITVLIHEHGHTIMRGLSEKQIKAWERIFARVDKSKKCEGMYTCFDRYEFWAEMTAIWFYQGTNLQYGFNNGLVLRRPQDIRLLDPEAYTFLEEVYGPPQW